MNDNWIKATDDLPEEGKRVRVELPKCAYIGSDGYWHDTVTNKKIPSYLVTGWSHI